MEWVIGALAVGVGGWYAISRWLAVAPPPAQLACRTCPKLQRQIQAWKLACGGMTLLACAAAIWALAR
jgi:hypothetical protein